MTTPTSDPIPSVNRARIAAGLRALGLSAGDGLMVHSSLKSFGHVEGGARTVIEALQEVLTPSGTLMMPSFNHGGAFGPGRAGYYHPGETPTSNGAIPDLFWRLPDVWRGLNPTHAFAAWGRHARRYIEFHHRTLTMGPDSPLGLLGREDGFCLLIGVTFNSNSYHHVVEMTLGAPCLGLRTVALPVVLPGGRRVMARTWGWRERGCPYTASRHYEQDMRAAGQVCATTVGNSRLELFRLRACFAAAARLLREGADGLPPCQACPIRPMPVAEMAPSDWDRERGCLKPDSEAWTY